MFMKIIIKRIVNAFYIIGQNEFHYDLVRN